MNLLKPKIENISIVFAAFFLMPSVWDASVHAQSNEQLWAQNPNDKGPPPDDPNEPDVGKRPRFLWELGRQRLLINPGIKALDAFPSYERSKDRPIPVDRKQAVLDSAKKWLFLNLHPQSEEAIQWYGMWTRVAVRDIDERLIERKSELSWLLAQWDIGDYQIRTGNGLRIRFPKRTELEFRVMPSGFKGYSRDWDYVSKEGLRSVLSEFFVIPFDEYDEFWVRGYIETLAGVDVFVGTFKLRSVRLDPADGARPIGWDSWGGTHRILITDSDPQYLCVSFDMSEDEANDVTNP